MTGAFCTIDDCTSIVFTHNLCMYHWEHYRPVIQMMLHPLSTPGQRLATELQLMPYGCLEWIGGRNDDGYGQIYLGDQHVLVHRLVWTVEHGPIPPGLLVLHHCDNPPCVQTAPSQQYPDGHLFLGTHQDNTDDMINKGRAAWQQ